MREAGAPGRDADVDGHVNEGGQAHGEGAEEEALGWVVDHGRPDARVEGVAQGRDGEEEGEEEGVGREEGD